MIWDGVSKSVRCTYLGLDEMENVCTFHSVAFSPSGGHIAAGSDAKGAVFLFDTNRPGKIPLVSARCGSRSPSSAVEWRKDSTGVLAIGHYSGDVSLSVIDLRTDDSSGIQVVSMMDKFVDPKVALGGVTQVQFSSCGYYVFSAHRKKNAICQWDLRNSKMVHKYELSIDVEDTNQRLYFDIVSERTQDAGSHSNSLLISGDRSGNLAFFNPSIKNSRKNIRLSNFPLSSVSFNPISENFAVSAGERRFGLRNEMIAQVTESSVNIEQYLNSGDVAILNLKNFKAQDS